MSIAPDLDEGPDDDLLTCESCSAKIAHGAGVYSEGCHFCDACYAAWRAEFDVCEHDWEQHYDEFGDPGRYCKKCSGFVADVATGRGGGDE